MSLLIKSSLVLIVSDFSLNISWSDSLNISYDLKKLALKIMGDLFDWYNLIIFCLLSIKEIMPDTL